MYKLLDEIKVNNGKCSLRINKPYKAVFGLGEKFDSVNQKGLYVRSVVREKCFAQGEYTYCPIPFFVTPNGFGVYVDTYVEVDFDFRNDNYIDIQFSIDSFRNVAKVYYFEGSMKQIISEYRKLVGLPRLFPKWVLGAWMSSNRWHLDSEVREQLLENKNNNFSHNVLVIEPWSDLTTHYIVNGCNVEINGNGDYAKLSDLDFKNNDIWPNFPKLVDDIHKDNIKLLLWVVPIYAQDENLETRCNVDSSLRENEYVKNKKYVVMKQNGAEYIIPKVWCIGSMIPDFTNKEASKYWFDRFSYLKEIGIDGFKTDGGEFVHETDTIFANGMTGLEGINAYPEMYEAAFSDFVGDKGIIYSRAGGVKTPLNSILWAGDQESTWDEFRAMVKAGLSSGMSGISAWGYDIAGFSGYLPTRALYLRSVEFACFIPIMQWHSDPVSNNRCDFSGAWKCNDRSPWNMAGYLKDKSLINLLRKKFDMHYNLLPYQYMLQMESSKTGIPAMRHLAIEFADDQNVYNIDNEFMLGDSLLIAPVLDDYIDKMEIYLPNDIWYNIYTNEVLTGGKHVVTLSDEVIPVYMRNNSCIPLNLNGGVIESHVGNKMDSYKELTFLVSGKGEYEFNDDLGNQIKISWDKDNHQELANKQGLKINVLHIEKDKIYRG